MRKDRNDSCHPGRGRTIVTQIGSQSISFAGFALLTRVVLLLFALKLFHNDGFMHPNDLSIVDEISIFIISSCLG